MRALLLIDLQHDFLPGGALAVPDGDAVVPLAQRMMDAFELVVATQDWHPADHGSFAANHPGKRVGDEAMLNGLRQVLWPVHCVQETRGADFAPGLDLRRISHVTRKGMDRAIDSYSGFFDNGHRQATDLHAYLQGRGVSDLCVMGLATDYCVKFTTLDARQQGYRVKLLADGCRGVNVRPGDVAAAMEEMRAAGVEMTTTDAILGSMDGGVR